jgi:quinol monooxygenase YgiN
MAIHAIAEILVKEGALPAFLGLTETLIAESNAEPGVLEYRFFQDKANPRKFFVLEVYKDKEAVAAHRAMPHTLAFFEQQADIVESAGLSVVLPETEFIGKEDAAVQTR